MFGGFVKSKFLFFVIKNQRDIVRHAGVDRKQRSIIRNAELDPAFSNFNGSRLSPGRRLDVADVT
jgi:hypothetical protein